MARRVESPLVSTTDSFVATLLNASAEGMLTGAIVSVAALARPGRLATYTDRLYLGDRAAGRALRPARSR